MGRKAPPRWVAGLGIGAALGLAALAGAPGASASAIAPGPSCAEGPVREGKVIDGTPCADRIVVPAGVALVRGGAGDDVIVGARSGAVAAVTGSCETGCHLEVGSQTFEGGPGDDVVFGDRGNDTLRGGGGDDRLYGGIGDDVLEGGEGDDWLCGGFGADTIDGGEGSDYVRGDATIDHIFDRGVSGTDTLSFSTGVTPGFANAGNPTGAPSFPGQGGERGIYLKLGEGGVNALDGEPSLGGGNDEVEPGAFERIVGTPFSDYIVGSEGAEEILGGGGADVIEGGGGADVLRGGADGDLLIDGPGAEMLGEAGEDACEGGGSTSGCEGTSGDVEPRDPGKVSVGVTSGPVGGSQVYLLGSDGPDGVTASYAPAAVSFSLSSGAFDASAADSGGCAVSSATTASCPLSGRLDSLLLAGLGGDDTIAAGGFPDGVGVVESGGPGEDQLSGGATEDVLVDGLGSARDLLEAGPGDDALTHNGGPDRLDGGEGSDLFLSVSLCDGQTIDGGAAATGDRDNASWARLRSTGVDARLDRGLAGEAGPGEAPVCAAGSLDHLEAIEDLEGSNQDDVLYGNEGNNQLLGHMGEDTYYALGGQDSILANSGSGDRVIDCGADADTAVVDLGGIDPAPIECESVREGPPDEFKEVPPPSEPPPRVAPSGGSAEPAPPAPRRPPPDRKRPRTKLLRHPRARLHGRAPRRVSFRFASSERGSRFRCRIDRRPYRRCHSPRAYAVGRGAHAFRVFAIDAAGNRDASPAVFRFSLRRR
jgi:Ca2+-binding RTX toxin-like protein